MSGGAGAERAVSIRLASSTDVGRLRAANEDRCDLFVGAGPAHLLVVADGMGGHRGGATASQLAVATIGEVFEQRFSQAGAIDGEQTLRQAIEEANRRIFSMALADPELEGMGTTVVAFLLEDPLRGSVAHVGDSRAYRHRRGRLEPLTTDHSVVAEMQQRGLITAEEALFHPRRNEILRSVGVLPAVEIETRRVDLEVGDAILLCSDGLTGVLDDEEIAAVVAGESPEAAVETLIRLANERGGPDNITVQLLALPATTEGLDLPGPETVAAPEPPAPNARAAAGAEARAAAGSAGSGSVAAGPDAAIGESSDHRDRVLRRRRPVVWLVAVALVLAAAGLFLSR
jgi:protein phosphatase